MRNACLRAEKLPGENTFGIREIQPVFAQIFQTLRFVPRELHTLIICIRSYA